ncbi:type II toxin-antitoxin system PemK/MazF family toxin [Pseudoclavibacter sp. CFCC 13611]|uniref:type II toxin-antitoxin system PemK/MazF family toxin n=1 Tax=Pseudoclavibacter sp. CFCC 13611 TaxID=2615178 RepID=UPI00130188CD|nr:type II toxin-antitoxin system PemK/MazF family toxin [Pseudoclavibacter sp. CFCC 13611]KAB1664328.1 type II toxin-antitoxin system PemK/MazF family toxin [Pseudoclavibacter sp. CFCC 13611]
MSGFWSSSSGGCAEVSLRALRSADTEWTNVPNASTGYAFGEIVWTWVPFGERGGHGKDRPCVVVGSVSDRGDLLMVYLTSRDHDDDADHLFLGYGSWDRSDRGSWAQVRRLFQVHHTEVRDGGAALDRMQARALRRTLRLSD